MKAAILSLLLSTAALAQTCDYYPLNTCSQGILGTKTFWDGIIVPGGVQSDGGAGIFDSLYVRGNAGVDGGLTVKGSSVCTAANGVCQLADAGSIAPCKVSANGDLNCPSDGGFTGGVIIQEKSSASIFPDLQGLVIRYPGHFGWQLAQTNDVLDLCVGGGSPVSGACAQQWDLNTGNITLNDLGFATSIFTSTTSDNRFTNSVTISGDAGVLKGLSVGGDVVALGLASTTDGILTSGPFTVLDTTDQAQLRGPVLMYLDAGVGRNLVVVGDAGVMTNLGVAGTISIAGNVENSSHRGTIVMSGGSGTTTVNSGAVCVCSTDTAFLACQPSVSSTTLTVTVTGGGSNTVSYICL